MKIELLNLTEIQDYKDFTFPWKTPWGKMKVYATRDYAKFTSTDVHSSYSPMKGGLQNRQKS